MHVTTPLLLLSIAAACTAQGGGGGPVTRDPGPADAGPPEAEDAGAPAENPSRPGGDAGVTDAGGPARIDAGPGGADAGRPGVDAGRPCLPACGGRACGDDGCGGVCGVCAVDESCVAGTCEPPPREHEDLIHGVVGFARGVTGGAGGPVCWVDNASDSGAGSLRACASGAGPRWVRFRRSFDIRLSSPIPVSSDTTIDGRGVDVDLVGRGLRVRSVSNVIIHNLTIRDGGGGDSEDAIQIIEGARLIWVDHVTLVDFPDGLLDITRGSTDVTVSWCHFRDHDKTMLIGASDDHTGDRAMRVTLHHNYFDGTRQRHPRIRYAKVHAFNNYLRHWASYGMGASTDSQLLSEHNIFDAGGDTDGIVSIVGSDARHGAVESRREWTIDGATIDEEDTESVFEARDSYPYSLEVADAALRSRITAGVGWRSVPAP